MTISDDLAVVFDEIGSEVSVAGTLIKEFVDYESTDKEGVFALTLRASTGVKSGDLVTFTGSGEKFLVSYSFIEQFENAPVVFSCRMLKCQFLASFQRSAATTDPVTRAKVLTWVEYASVYVFGDSSNTGSGLNGETDNVLYSLFRGKVVCQKTVAVKTLDRVVLNGVKYQVGNVDSVNYPDLFTCELLKDTR